jgi:prepilin-type N-terminal cleavage/methylation domain-containing protein
MTSCRRRARGLTLIEVLLALAILALSLLALIPMFTLGAKANASSQDLGIANALAREKLEELISSPSTSPALQIPNNTSTVTLPGGGPLTIAGVGTFQPSDLPIWWHPTSGETSFSPTKPTTPSTGWQLYAFRRTWTVTAYKGTDLTVPVNSTTDDEHATYDVLSPPKPYYDVKLVLVTVTPIAYVDGSGNAAKTLPSLPGLMQTTQSAYVRFRSALSN